jgi:hypothetical protein
MALNLTVPALEDKPLINAETRPQKVLEFIASLPSGPLQAAFVLRDEMEILNRQKVSADSRLKVLETYRGHAIRLSAELSHIYCNSALPLSAEAKAHAAAAESLWLELAFGYKLSLLDQLNQLLNPGESALAQTIHRALEALKLLSMVYYETYFKVPASIWSDLHQLYFCAAQNNLNEITLNAEPCTIELVYKQALLMSLADPQHLAPQDMELVAEYIAKYADHTEIQPPGILENAAGVFVVNLASSRSPVPYLKTARQPDGNSDILLITVDLARRIHKHLKMLQTGDTGGSTNPSEKIPDARYQEILVYLIKHWGVAPKRVYRRTGKNSIAHLLVGLSDIHAFNRNPRQTVDHKVEKLSAASSWQVLNISAGGLALRKLSISPPSPMRIGELLAINNKDEKNWSIAVLRWASNGLQGQLDIGTELIAPNARAATARIVKHGDFEPALLLPELPVIRQANTLVTRCGIYAPARVLELNEDGGIVRIMITRLVERTRSFERFQFTVI